MSNSFIVNVELRDDLGKGASRRLRRLEDKIPGIVYGGDKKPQPLSLIHKEIIKHIEDESFYSSILTLKAGKKTEDVILKDLQRHPFKPKITHMDFMRVSATEKLHTSVPLHFTNEDICPGVKEGGVVNHSYTTVDIACLPKHLPEYIEVDMTDVELDQILHLSDIKMPKGVELVELSHGDGNDHDQAIATIHKSRASVSGDVDGEEGSEGEETEDAAE
ncbi:MAG: 50S ribosomal protein L25/general stress protein Ctc [Enterobacterales bacterium]|nr:50S ribosomal protein L25/general stress protein Ctc [Enterobacterales bacterium]